MESPLKSLINQSQKLSRVKKNTKLGQFTQEELNVVLTKIKSRKAEGLDEIPPDEWKTRTYDDLLLRFCNAVYKQNAIQKWTKGRILPFPKKGDFGITKNYRGITLTSLTAKVYNALLINCIEPEIEKILRKNLNGFRRNQPTTSQIITIRWIIERARAKTLEATLFVDFTKAFDSIDRRKMGQLLLAYDLHKETVTAIAMKGYSAFPKALASLEHHHQIVLCHIRTLVGGSFTPQQRRGWCILQLHPTR